MTAPGAQTSWRLRAALLVAGTLLGLLLMELALRVAHVAPPRVPNPPDADRRREDVRPNHLGLRERWEEVPPVLPRQCRVAVLGDSFAYGESVAFADTLPQQLQRRLQAALADQPVLVMNLGRPDNDTAQEAARYAALQPQLHANVLLLVAYVNDLDVPNPAYTLADIYGAGGAPDWFDAHSRVVAHLRARLRLALMQRRTVAWYRSGVDRNTAQSFDTMARHIRGLRADAQRDGVAFAMTLYPWLYQLDQYLLPEAHRWLGDLARQEQIPWVDLLPVFAGRPHETLRVSPANEHPNALGHRLAAEALTPTLTSLCRAVGQRE